MLMFALLFCIGALSSQSTNILVHLSLSSRDAAHLATLCGGVVTGCLLIILLIRAEHVCRARDCVFSA